MAAIPRFLKDPDATLDYTFDWSAWLNGGDTITGSSWIVPAGVTVGTDTHTGQRATAFISGGTLGATYSCVNRIVTANGLTDDRTLILVVVER